MKAVSVCIIAKNEEKRLPRLLESLKPYPFEIVVVDTGSTDSTKAIAEGFKAKVYDFAWCDDFSAARNFSLKMASNEWILMMDSDEWIESLDLEEMDYFQKKLSRKCGSVSRHNLCGEPGNVTGQTLDYTERFFSKRCYEYSGRIHEQLSARPGVLFDTLLMNISIGHDGYLMTNEDRIKKSKRNVELLELDYKEKPEDNYTLYQLAKGYEMINDSEKVVSYLSKVFASYESNKQKEILGKTPGELDFSLAYVQAMNLTYASALLNLNRPDEAINHLLLHYEELKTSADYLYQLGLSYIAAQKYEEGLDAFQSALSAPEGRRAGSNSFLSYFEIAKILCLIEEWDTARSLLEKCGDFSPAKELLSKLP